MRALSPIGSSLLIISAYVFTYGGSWSDRYMIPGGCLALAGVVLLALAAIVDPSVRSRHEAITELGPETEHSEETDKMTVSS